MQVAGKRLKGLFAVFRKYYRIYGGGVGLVAGSPSNTGHKLGSLEHLWRHWSQGLMSRLRSGPDELYDQVDSYFCILVQGLLSRLRSGPDELYDQVDSYFCILVIFF